MKILVIGATGMIGRQISKELIERGHATTLASRRGGDSTLCIDACSVQDLAALVEGEEVVVVAVSPPRDGSDTVAPTMQLGQSLIEVALKCNLKRLVIVGGAGSLLLPDGSKLLDAPSFPAEYKDEAIAHSLLLDKLRSEANEIDWVYISPAAVIAPGERTGKFTVGGDEFMTDSNGESRISVEDYAVMLADEIEQQSVSKQRISVAYT
jgi:putative NADH-flavin reductase